MKFLDKILRKIGIGKDKLYHFGVCFATTIAVGVVFGAISGFLSAMFLGIGKEYGDSKAYGNKWSWGDIIANTIGATAGLLLILMLS